MRIRCYLLATDFKLTLNCIGLHKEMCPTKCSGGGPVSTLIYIGHVVGDFVVFGRLLL